MWGLTSFTRVQGTAVCSEENMINDARAGGKDESGPVAANTDGMAPACGPSHSVAAGHADMRTTTPTSTTVETLANLSLSRDGHMLPSLGLLGLNSQALDAVVKAVQSGPAVHQAALACTCTSICDLLAAKLRALKAEWQKGQEIQKLNGDIRRLERESKFGARAARAAWSAADEMRQLRQTIETRKHELCMLQEKHRAGDWPEPSEWELLARRTFHSSLERRSLFNGLGYMLVPRGFRDAYTHSTKDNQELFRSPYSGDSLMIEVNEVRCMPGIKEYFKALMARDAHGTEHTEILEQCRTPGLCAAAVCVQTAAPAVGGSGAPVGIWLGLVRNYHCDVLIVLRRMLHPNDAPETAGLVWRMANSVLGPDGMPFNPSPYEPDEIDGYSAQASLARGGYGFRDLDEEFGY